MKKILALAAVGLSLSGCMWTLSNGDQIVLTPQSAVPLVMDKIKQGCASYDASKVADDALAKVATDAVNNATVTGVVQTVQQIATTACPLLDAVIQAPAKPAG